MDLLPDGTRIAAGAILAANSAWMDYFGAVWQFGLSLGGGLIIALTIYKLYLEIKIKKKSLRD